MRLWEYRPSAAYTSEFTQTLPESDTTGIKSIEGLLWLKRGAGEGDATKYLVQIIEQPFQVTAF